MSMSAATHMDVEDLRQQLRRRLERSGVLDSLRAQLRYRVLSELKSKTVLGSHERAPARIRALNALIIDYMKHHEHAYALSVFLAESSADKDDYTPEDVAQMLGVSLNHNDDNAMLEQIVASVSR